MKIRWKNLIPCVLIPLAVGGAAALLTRDGIEAFAALPKPALTPPAAVFPVAWTVLYILMGTASYFAAVSGRATTDTYFAYGIQLFLNFFWPILFFRLENYLFAFIWILLLWIAVAASTRLFFRASKTAGWLMVPYLAWVTFAAWLNYGVYLLNG